MDSNGVQIIDDGFAPRIAGHRLTVLDVFYYLHRGYDFDFIHRAMPSLTREQFDAVVQYVKEHHDELVEKDRRVEESHRRGREEQKAKGLLREIDESIPREVRIARMRERLRQLQKDQAEKKGDHSAG